MISFDYVPASDLDSAAKSGAAEATRFVAGGTTLIDLMKLGVENPTHVIDLNPLVKRDASLSAVSDLPSGGLRLGALAHMSDVAWDARVKERYPLVSQSLLLAASGQVRNMATIGGNVLQRTRCPYFRDTTSACNKRDPGSGCASLAGRHERQAIFGWTQDCVAVQPSDPAVALAALDARAEVLGPAGARTIPMREFHLTQREAAGMGEPLRETRLGPDELITGYRLPASTDGQAYVKVRERASYEYAIVSAAAAVRLDGNRIAAARIALGSVAQRPWRLPAAEAELPGTALTREALTPVIERAMADAAPLPQNGFKVTMARAAAVRSLLAAGGAP
jgi:xanthine dehydrogenase YagS FAD-binding subunit